VRLRHLIAPAPSPRARSWVPVMTPCCREATVAIRESKGCSTFGRIYSPKVEHPPAHPPLSARLTSPNRYRGPTYRTYTWCKAGFDTAARAAPSRSGPNIRPPTERSSSGSPLSNAT
jgi:hypothetical protein